MKRLLAFGDSNTYGYDPRSYFGGRYEPEDRWVDILAGMTGWEIINAGENGREIPKRRWELEDFCELYQRSGSIDRVLILLGGNDLLQGALPEKIAERMEKFLLQSGIAAEKFLLIAPPPLCLGAWVADEALVRASKEIGKTYGALAGRIAVEFIDASMWEIPLTFDGVHYSQQGHHRFAQLLAQELR